MSSKLLRVVLPIAVLALAPGSPSESRAGNLTGVLVGAGSAQNYPLPDAEVLLCPAGAAPETAQCSSAITGSDGWFRVQDVPPGAYTLYTQSKSGAMTGGTVSVDGSGDIHVQIVAP